MKSRFKILFAVDLRHAYYSNGKCNDFAVVPSEATRKLLKDLQLLYKVFENQLWVLAKVHDAGTDEDKPFVDLPQNQKFVFYLQLQQPLFMAVTNIDAKAFETKRFYFSNLSQNKADNILYLSTPITAYNNGVTYVPGMMVFVDPGANATVPTVFESIKENPAGVGSHAPSATDDRWQQRGRVQYATAADTMSINKSTASFTVNDTATVFNVTAYALNKTDNRTYDQEVPLSRQTALSFSETATPAEKNVQVDLSALSPGRYRVKINANNFDVYVDDEAASNQTFGIIEIFNHLPATNDFALLDAAGKVKDKVVTGRAQWLTYTISFANRLAFLKYVSLKKGVSGIEDSRHPTPAEYTFAPTPVPPQPADFFLSNKPVPLLQKSALFNLVLTHPISSEALKAPNPNPADPGMLSQLNNDFFSTVYLNY